MELKELTTLIDTPEKLIEKIATFRAVKDDDYLQYESENQSVLDLRVRPKKEVKRPTGKMKEDGSEETRTTFEEVARIPVAFQKIIVARAIMFLTGAPVERESDPQTEAEKILAAMTDKTWEDNKLDYRLDEIAEGMMSEKECAVIFHFDEVESSYWGDLGFSIPNKQDDITVGSRYRLRHTILKRSDDGSIFYPVFNELNNLTAFGRGYEVKKGDKTIQYFDVYTAEALYKYIKTDGREWAINPSLSEGVEVWPIENKVKKIPVVYFYQKRVEWADVKWAIDQFVKTFSDLSETNAYFGSPILKATGKIKGIANKGEKGKIFQMEGEGANLEYVTWNQAPESIRLELDMLKDTIYTLTQTPDITFKELKGIGQLSGIALRMMFLDPHAKANRKHKGNYGEGVQRMLNYIKAAMAVINTNVKPAVNMAITPKFGMFLPENELEALEIAGKKIDNISTATGGKESMTQEDAVNENPYVTDPDKTYKQLQAQGAEERITLTM